MFIISFKNQFKYLFIGMDPEKYKGGPKVVGCIKILYLRGDISYVYSRAIEIRKKNNEIRRKIVFKLIKLVN